MPNWAPGNTKPKNKESSVGPEFQQNDSLYKISNVVNILERFLIQTRKCDSLYRGGGRYQGENNMMNTKGNAAVNVGYSCKQRELVKGWRAIWFTHANCL